MSTEVISVARTIGAPVKTVFEVLADPAKHAAIDGTGWVGDAVDDAVLDHEGQIFRVAMFHDNHPNKTYEMANRVSALAAPEVIAWEPGQEDQDGNLEFGGWSWRYDLVSVGYAETEVTLTYDWSAVPEGLRQHITFPPFPTEHLDNSLANLAELATD